jgi:hypothetical protein
MADKTKSKATAATKKPRRTAPAKVKPAIVEAAPAAPIVKRAKPVFRIGTWIAILLLIALIELTIYLNHQKEKAITEATPSSQMTTLFNENSVVSSIEIAPASGGLQAVKVTRDAKNVWAMEMPEKTEANQGVAEEAATQISALKASNPINGEPEIFGLKNPAFTITIEFASGNTHTLEVGDATPTNSGYYVRVDHDKIMVTDLSGIQSLLQLVSSPPYLNTPTPTALPPTPTPVPTTEAVTTPAP